MSAAPPRILPDPANPLLTRRVTGLDHTGAAVEASVTVERPLTLYLNGREIVTMMTILDRPEDLAVGYLLNQGMLRPESVITAVEYDDDLGVVVVRTPEATDFEEKLRRKTLTSGCAQGTAFGDLMEGFSAVVLDPDARLRTSELYRLLHRLNTLPSLYLEAGAIHGCALCEGEGVIAYMEDVGRHNAVDKIAGWMHRQRVPGAGKTFYTTGRLTSEMVIKTVRMGIPILVSRSGFTAWGVELAREAHLTLVGRCKGKRFTVLAGEGRIVFDAEPSYVEEESAKHWRKNSREAEDA